MNDSFFKVFFFIESSKTKNIALQLRSVVAYYLFGVYYRASVSEMSLK